MSITREQLQQAPKVLLHDHLDGGLRPETIIDLARERGHRLPADDPAGLRRWFTESADSGSLERYLQTFDHTIAVMQTEYGLRRVAREMVLDVAADGVVYVESRWAPGQHLAGGLTADQVVQAVRDGLVEGMDEAAAAGHPIVARQILTGMRHTSDSVAMAELTVRHRDALVCGFDIAGAEAGHPPSRHRQAFRIIKEYNNYLTIHAGEGYGLPSIWEAVQLCGANRIGHGVRIVEDIEGAGDDARLGDLASYIRNQQLPLELCPSSNVQTGAVASLAEHPLAELDRLGFRVTVNTDNRLMSGTSMTQEFGHLVDQLGYDLAGLRRLTVNAARSAFFPYPDRQRMIADLIEPGYAALGAPREG